MIKHKIKCDKHNIDAIKATWYVYKNLGKICPEICMFCQVISIPDTKKVKRDFQLKKSRVYSTIKEAL
jgi:hypothetical protein